MIVCINCGCLPHPGEICAKANADDQTDGAACWCEASFPVKVFMSEAEAFDAITRDLRDNLEH